MIDPSIPLASRPQVQIASPLETYGQVLNIKNAQQNAALQQEQLRHVQNANREQELAMRDQQAVQTILGETGGDIGKALPKLAGAVTPRTFMSIQKSYADAQKALNGTPTEQLAKLKYANEQFAGLINQAKQLSPEQYAQAYPQLVEQARALKPDLKIPDQPIPQEALGSLGLGVLTDAQLIAREEEKRKVAAEARAQAEEGRKATAFPVEMQAKQAEAKLKGLEVAGQKPIQPAEKARIDAEGAKAVQQQKYQDARLGLERQRVGLERQRVNIQAGGVNGAANGTTVTGEDFLKTLPPGLAGQVRAIAEGKTAIPSGSRGGAAMQIRNAVFQYDPTFSEQRAQVRKSFTTGKDGQNIGALNTAMVHLGRLGDAAEALNNGSFTPGNEAYNYLRDKFGSKTVTNFELLKDAVAGEMAAALKGTATDIEIANMKKSIRASNSPAQMRGVVTQGMSVLKDKANTYEERYKAQMPNDTWSPVLPSAKQAMEKYGVGKSESGKGGGVIVQHSPSTGQYRYSTDGGKTWQAGQPK